MTLKHRSLLHRFLIISPSMYCLAAPTVPLLSASVVTESLVVLPSVFSSAPSTDVSGNTVTPSTSAVAHSSTVALLDSELAAGSLTWIATTETVLVIPKPYGPFTSNDSSGSSTTLAALNAIPPSTSGVGSTRSGDVTSSVLPSSGSASLAASIPTSTSATDSRTTLYVLSTSSKAEADIQNAVPSATISSSAGSSIHISTGLFTDISPSPSPVATDITDPNPTAESEATSSAASQQARRQAILGAFLTISLLTFLAGFIACMRCNILTKLRHMRRRSRRVRFELPNMDQCQKVSSFPAENEKDSIVPGPPASEEVFLPVLPQQQGSALGGADPRVTSYKKLADWRVFASNIDGQFEDVTHILSTDVFAPLECRRDSPGSDSILSASSKESSDDSHSPSRASGGSASMTGVSYKSCESRYSTPSVERHSKDGPPGSESAESMSPSLYLCRPTSPPSPDLVKTPDLSATSDNGLGPFSVVGRVGRKEPHVLTRGIRDSEGTDLGSEWDVARAYGAHSSLGKDSVVSIIVENMEPVEVGGRKCVLVRG